MRVSYTILKELLDLRKTPEELSELFNFSMLPVEEIIELDDDTVFDVEITPNRPDLLGHIGVSYQIAPFLRVNVNEPEISYPENDEPIENKVTIEIKDESCGRYSAILIEGVEVKESPNWLKKRIESFGLRPINNIVDISNYVMFMTGHPIHTFDFSKIEGDKIIVRGAKKGEKILCLDGEERELDERELVIADSEKPVAIAGIIGGEESGVDESTKTVLIESAYFDPSRIRFSSKRLKVSTDSSYRFERGADFNETIRSAKLAATLITKLAGGKALKGILDIKSREFQEKKVRVRFKRVNSVLGTKLSEKEITDVLSFMGFEIVEKETHYVVVKIPSRRRDISREIDVIEEIAISIGFDKIENTIPLIFEEKVYYSSLDNRTERIHQKLTGAGFFEVLTYSFISEEENSISPEKGEPIKVKNPLSLQFSEMRLSLLPSLLKVSSYNLRRELKGVKIYEFGKVFKKLGDTPYEEERIGLLISGKFKENWSVNERDAEFYELKGIVEEIFSSFNCKIKFKREEFKSLLNSLGIYCGKEKVGFIGEVEPQLRKKYDIEGKTYYSELYFEKFKGFKEKKVKDVPKFPSVWFDSTFVVKESTMYSEIEEFIRNENVKYLENFFPYYVYKGKGIEKDERAITIRFIFRSHEKTLKKEDVEEAFFELRKKIADKFGLKIK